MKTELKPSEVFGLLKDMIQNNIELAKHGLTPIAFNIEGKPGISKTSVVKQVSDSLSTHHYIRLNVAEIEVGDLIGFPITQYKVSNDKQIIWVNDKLLNDYIAKGYTHSGESRMSYAIPEWLVDRMDKPVILVLDDYNRGLPIMMNACMRLTDEQETSSWKLPQGSTVILTCNPDNGDDIFNVSQLDKAQKTRFITINMKADVEDWALNYAEVVGLPSPFINFMLKHKEIIHGTGDETADQNLGNLRIWSKFFHAISIYNKNLKNNWKNIFDLGQNSLPVEHLLLLQGFINDKLDKVETPEKLLTQDSEKTLKYLENFIGRTNIAPEVITDFSNFKLKEFNSDGNIIELNNNHIGTINGCQIPDGVYPSYNTIDPNGDDSNAVYMLTFKNNKLESYSRNVTKRNDMSSIISRRITNYTIVNHKKFTKAMIENYILIMESGLLSPDIVILSIKKTASWFPQIMTRTKLLKLIGLA